MILPIMILTIIIMKLFVVGEMYKEQHGCWPISYYFGEINGCRRTIYENVDGFENIKTLDFIRNKFDFSIFLTKMNDLIVSTQFFMYNIMKEKMFDLQMLLK
jgi:hypothetical protein